MMDSAAALFQKLRNRGIVARRLQQLYTAFTERQHRNPDLLVLHRFGVNILEPECVRPKLEPSVDARRRNAEMINVSRTVSPRRRTNSPSYELFHRRIKIRLFLADTFCQLFKLFLGAVAREEVRHQPLAQQLQEPPARDSLFSCQTPITLLLKGAIRFDGSRKVFDALIFRRDRLHDRGIPEVRPMSERKQRLELFLSSK